MRIGLPRRADGEIAVDHLHVAEADPRAPAGFLRPRRGRRVAREDAVVIPFPARLLVDHDDRPHEFDLAEIDPLSAQGAQAVAGPDLVGLDERSARAVGDHDVVQRESSQEISADAADVDEAVTVSLDQTFDVAPDALAAEVGVGGQISGADQQ